MSTPALSGEGNLGGAAVNRRIAFSALLLIGALYVVGIVSNGVIRHVVQTAPLWVTVVLGMRRSVWTKWTALPCLLLWLLLMTLIWLFLLGWAHIISGTFSPTEIAMTLIVGLSSLAGIVLSMRIKTDVRVMSASALLLLMLIVQLMALRISFLPALAQDHWR